MSGLYLGSHWDPRGTIWAAAPQYLRSNKLHIFSSSIQHVIITEIYRQEEYADHSSESRLHDYNGVLCS